MYNSITQQNTKINGTGDQLKHYSQPANISDCLLLHGTRAAVLLYIMSIIDSVRVFVYNIYIIYILYPYKYAPSGQQTPLKVYPVTLYLQLTYNNEISYKGKRHVNKKVSPPLSSEVITGTWLVQAAADTVKKQQVETQIKEQAVMLFCISALAGAARSRCTGVSQRETTVMCFSDHTAAGFTGRV